MPKKITKLEHQPQKSDEYRFTRKPNDLITLSNEASRHNFSNVESYENSPRKQLKRKKHTRVPSSNDYMD